MDFQAFSRAFLAPGTWCSSNKNRGKKNLLLRQEQHVGLDMSHFLLDFFIYNRMRDQEAQPQFSNTVLSCYSYLRAFKDMQMISVQKRIATIWLWISHIQKGLSKPKVELVEKDWHKCTCQSILSIDHHYLSIFFIFFSLITYTQTIWSITVYTPLKDNA